MSCDQCQGSVPKNPLPHSAERNYAPHSCNGTVLQQVKTTSQQSTWAAFSLHCSWLDWDTIWLGCEHWKWDNNVLLLQAVPNYFSTRDANSGVKTAHITGSRVNRSQLERGVYILQAVSRSCENSHNTVLEKPVLQLVTRGKSYLCISKAVPAGGTEPRVRANTDTNLSNYTARP